MLKQEIKTRIRRRIKKGDFKTVNVSNYNLKATANALIHSSNYYTELREDGMLAYDTLTGRLTIYRARG